MPEVPPAVLDEAVQRARVQAAAWHPPRARKQLHVDASALLARLKLPANVKYVNVALNPIPDLMDILGFEDVADAREYATTADALEDVAKMTGGLTSGQTSPLRPTTVYYDLRANDMAVKLGMATDPIENVLAHETIHLAQYAKLRKAGKDPIRETIRSNIVNQYADNPMEADAFKRAPALAHLVITYCAPESKRRIAATGQKVG